jgi:hypothetical protein
MRNSVARSWTLKAHAGRSEPKERPWAIRREAAYRIGCLAGFHSRASFCASVICAGVIDVATLSRPLAACLDAKSKRGASFSAAKLYNICART